MKYISSFDGLRGLAVFLVIIRHSVDGLVIEGDPFIYKLYWRVAQSLWFGVDLFFVLSGFLITSILLESKNSENYFSGFYGRRALRILPAFVTVTVPVMVVCLWHGQSIRSFIPVWLFAANWPVAWGGEIPLVSHFWSLAVEDQFYFVWPLVILYLSRRNVAWACVLLIILSTVSRIVGHHQGLNAYVIYKITPMRLDGLALGALLSILVAIPKAEQKLSLWLKYICFLSIAGILTVCVTQKLSFFPFTPEVLMYGLPFVNLGAVCLVYYCWRVNFIGTRFSVFLESAPLRWLGKYSYALYLWHIPVLFALHSLFIPQGNSISIFSGFALVTAYLVISCCIARLSWLFVEQPALSLRGYFKPRRSKSPPLECTADTP